MRPPSPVRRARERAARRALLVATPLAVLLAGLHVPTAHAGLAPRIIGGGKTPGGEYQAQLRSVVALIDLDADSQDEGQFCAGTLIDARHVLTAAHCVVEEGTVRTRLAPSSFAVLAGRRDLATGSLDAARMVPVSTYFVNPYFNVDTVRWDMAVLRLARPITDVPTTPVLGASEADALGVATGQATGLVAGWGDTDPDDEECCYPTSMYSVDVPIRSDATCRTNLARAPYVAFDTEFQFCAGRLGVGAMLGADTCQGDSGGPLMVSVDGTPRVAGVTSFGVGCGQRYYGVYARWSAIQGWLEGIPGLRGDDPRDPGHGPGDLGIPTVVGTAQGYTRARLSITAPTSGAAPQGYTTWLRMGSGARARDVFLGRTSGTTVTVPVPAVRRAMGRTLLVRALGPSGEGPPRRVVVRPRVDGRAPTTTTGVRASRSGSWLTLTWRAAVDRQSGIDGYQLQRVANGVRVPPTFTTARRVRMRVGASHGVIRVRAFDRAGNAGPAGTAIGY